MTWDSFKAGVANDFTNELTLAAPVGKGEDNIPGGKGSVKGPKLFNSISYEVTEDGFTVHLAPQAKYVEFGTAPHIIEAKNAKSLHWKSEGQDHFAQKVYHPGTKANPFIRNTLRNKLARIIQRNAQVHLQ